MNFFYVIENNKAISVASNKKEATEALGGFDTVFINEDIPIDCNVESSIKANSYGYYVKCDSSDFDKTKLSKELNNISSKFTKFKDLNSHNSDELDFEEISVWSLKEMLIKAYEIKDNLNC